MRKAAFVSVDEVYRYWLVREWDDSLPKLGIIGVNPSTADAEKDDQTIRKDIGFSKRLGYGGFVKCNLAAFRARDPKACIAAHKKGEAVGPRNTAFDIEFYFSCFDIGAIIAAWGANGKHFPEQVHAIEAVFTTLWCWGKTEEGMPRHPLMLPYSTKLERYQ